MLVNLFIIDFIYNATAVIIQLDIMFCNTGLFFIYHFSNVETHDTINYFWDIPSTLYITLLYDLTK